MKTRSFDRPCGFWTVAVLTLLILASATSVAAQEPYRKPPQAIQDVLDALPTPEVSINPGGSHMILSQPPGYPSIEDFSQPMLRIAGLRIDPVTNGPSRPRYSIGYAVKAIPDGKEVEIDLPADAKLGSPKWSPDGQKFAFTNTRDSGIDLWVGGVDGNARKIDGVVLNSAYGTEEDRNDPRRRNLFSPAIRWMPDSRTLLIQRIPAGRGEAPQEAKVPIGPNIQETSAGGPGRFGRTRICWKRLTTSRCSTTTARVNSRL